MDDSFFPDPPKMVKSAVLSPCGKYRYSLMRQWGKGRAITFICLNPSVADHTVDDPTITRCIGFAKSWGYDQLIVRNLFALRATNPKELLTADDPYGPDANVWLSHADTTGSTLVAAWGAKVPFGRDKQVLEILERRNFLCLGVTKHGHPRHPLFVPADTKLMLYRDALGVYEYGVPE